MKFELVNGTNEQPRSRSKLFSRHSSNLVFRKGAELTVFRSYTFYEVSLSFLAWNFHATQARQTYNYQACRRILKVFTSASSQLAHVQNSE